MVRVEKGKAAGNAWAIAALIKLIPTAPMTSFWHVDTCLDGPS